MANLQSLSIAEGASGESVNWPRAISFWSGWFWIAKSLGYIAIALIYIPLVWLAIMSLTDAPLSGRLETFSLTNYVALIQYRQWVPPLVNSLVLGAIVSPISMFLATLVGREIVRMRNGSPVLMFALLPLFIPGLTLGAGLFMFFKMALGLELGFWSILVAHLIWSLPFSLLLVLVVASRFDLRLLEAAEDLGATPLRRFVDIEFPILKSGIFGAGIFGFLLSFTELLRSIFVRGTETTMPIYNWSMAASQQSQVPVIFSLSTIILVVTLPLLATFFVILFSRMGEE